MAVVELPAALVKAVAQREALLVVGTGASIAATGDPNSPVSWKGLLRDGLRFTADQELLSAATAEYGEGLLEDGYFDAVASIVNKALQGRRGDWLMAAFDELTPRDGGGRLLEAIAQVPAAALITTNYDNLLGSYLDRTPVCWTTQGFATALNKPEALPRAILHVHGCYIEPDSIILDEADYERLSRSPAMEALQAAAATRPLLFVGCGPDGLKDPHFTRLWDWLGDVTTRQHYALLPRDVDSKAMRAVSREHLNFIFYEGDAGDPHAGLPLALEQLTEEVSSEADQLQSVGRVALEAAGTVVDEVRVVAPAIQGFAGFLPEGDGELDPDLKQNERGRMRQLLGSLTRGADLCVLSTAVSEAEATDLLKLSETELLVPLDGGGFLFGSPREEPIPIRESVVEVDFSEDSPKLRRAGGAGGRRSLRVTSVEDGVAGECPTLVIGDAVPRLVAPSGRWAAEFEASRRGTQQMEMAGPADGDSLLLFDLSMTQESGALIRQAQLREVVYGLSRERYAALRRVIEGQAPLTPETTTELMKMLAPLDDTAFELLRRDLAAAGAASEEQRLHHVAAPVDLRSAPEAVYELLTSDREVSQQALQALLPFVRRTLRRPVDAGAALPSQAGGPHRLLFAASLGDFDRERARSSFHRQRTLLSFVADQGLRLTYTLRSREASSSKSPPDRQFLIHCFAEDEAATQMATRQSVAAAVQSTFHGAYFISYSSAVEEDLEDVQIAAGRADGYARRWIIPTSASHSWPVSDHGFITDYIRTLPGEIAVTWECRGSDGAVELAGGGPAVGRAADEGPFEELKRLALDPAYSAGGVSLRCCVSVRGVEGEDAEVAEEVASLVGSEVFGASAFEVRDSDEDDCAPISAGHALLAMHAPFGWLYSTSYDTPARFVRPLKNQNFAAGVPVGIAQRKGVDRDYPEKVTLADEERFHHVHVVGRPGVGKTTLLKRMILGDLEAGNGVTVVDPHGGLADWVVARLPTHRLQDLVLVDLDAPAHAATLNLLDADAVGADDYDRVVSEVIHFMRQRSYHMWHGPVFEQLVRLGFLSMRDPGYPVAPALTDLVLLLANQDVRRALSLKVENEELRDGWRLQGAQDPKHYAEVLQWVTSKFDQLTKDPTLRATLGSAHSTLDIGAAVREGKVLIFRLAGPRISEQAADFIGSMLLTALQRELLDLSTSKDRPSHFVYIDEFHRFATLGLERLVVEARKFRVGMTLAHQNLDQLSAFHAHTGHVLDQVPSTLVGNAGTLIVFPVSSYDRERLARELGCAPEEIGELARFQALARIAVSSGSIEPFTIEIEDMGEPDDIERMTEVRRMMREQGIWVPSAQVLESVSERHASLRRWARPKDDPPSVKVPSPPPPPSPKESSFLDQWLEKRKARLEASDQLSSAKESAEEASD
jgi:SIR2-like protein/type IV secretion system coupling TraD/TrwB family protein